MDCSKELAVEKEVTAHEKSSPSDESDDELLVPAKFLYEAKPFNEIHTPKTVHTPINDDLSPITPENKVVKNSKKKKSRKLCFSKLVKEKAAQDEIDKKLSKMNEELKEGLENGGIFNMILSEEGKRSDGEESDNESQETSDLLPQHRIKLEKNIKKMNDGFGNDFSDGFPGEKVFIYQPSPVDLQTPNCIKSLMGFKTSAKSIPSNDTDPLTDEFLMSGSLVDLIVFDKSIDPCVMDWLLSCICFSPKFEVIDATYNGLWAITRLKNLELHWQFTTEKFLTLLGKMGASNLFTSSHLQELFHLRFDFKHGLDRLPEDELSFIFLHRFQTILKSFSYYMKQNPLQFSKSDIMLNVLLGLRLAIALEINFCAWEAEVHIGCAIDLYSEDDWNEEAIKICINALELSSNHSNQLQMVDVIPVTERGRELKKLMAIIMLTSIVSGKDIDVNNYANVMKGSTVSKVVDLISPIQITQETDFHKMFSTISFLNHCVPEESITAANKRTLENLITVLRRLNGDIRDPGGYYLNRTKVKNLIIRTLNRLTHICNGLQTQSSLDGFFGEKVSSFDQLKFETLQDQPNTDLLTDEENLKDVEAQHQLNEQKSGVKCESPSSGSPTDSDTEVDLELV